MSSVVVITAPTVPLVSLDEAKVHLRVDHDDDDNYIDSLVAAATGHIDGPAGWLGRALVTQTLEWRGDEFCDPILLGYPPIVSITSVKYDDTDGVEQTLAAATYRLVGAKTSPRLELAYGESWPSTRGQSEAVRVRYLAGYGTPYYVPMPIRQAAMLLIGVWHANREAVVIGVTPAELPMAVDALLAPFRRF